MTDTIAHLHPLSQDQSYMTSLRDYYLERIGSKRPLLQQALSDITNKIGVVFHERLVNMPIQVVSPLLRSFDADLTAAVCHVCLARAE